MLSERNTNPEGPLLLLRRVLNCNKGQLADRLGVTIHTLRVWERDGLSDNGRERCKQLFRAIMRNAESEWLWRQNGNANADN